MSERSQLIDRLQTSADSRASYVRGKINVLVPAQLHALRLRRKWTQEQFAHEACMKQSRVSAMEQPGAVNFNMETLIRSAATFGVGLVVKFVPFSEMLRWENSFDQDSFNPAKINKDVAFLSPSVQMLPQNVAPDFGSIVFWGSIVHDIAAHETVMIDERLLSEGPIAANYEQAAPITLPL